MRFRAHDIPLLVMLATPDIPQSKQILMPVHSRFLLSIKRVLGLVLPLWCSPSEVRDAGGEGSHASIFTLVTGPVTSRCLAERVTPILNAERMVQVASTRSHSLMWLIYRTK